MALPYQEFAIPWSKYSNILSLMSTTCITLYDAICHRFRLRFRQFKRKKTTYSARWADDSAPRRREAA